MTVKNRTHTKRECSFEETVQILRDRIVTRGDLEHASVERQLEVISQLSEFPLGRFVLENKGANGFWTDYMISHPKNGKISGLNIEGQPFSPLEDFFLNRCPVVVAHQERFSIFQHLMQERLKDGAVLASIPCGMMRDLLTLDFSKVHDFKLIGVDIDEESLSLAQKLSDERQITSVEFLQNDAWQVEFDEELDLITSSGLNVYEPNPEKVLELYIKFFHALKPGGVLITSVLTHPPGESTKTDWDLQGISPEDLLTDRILHKDILDIKWRNFRSLENLTEEFKRAGFSEVFVYMDKHRIFPTIVAQKAIKQQSVTG